MVRFEWKDSVCRVNLTLSQLPSFFLDRGVAWKRQAAAQTGFHFATGAKSDSSRISFRTGNNLTSQAQGMLDKGLEAKINP